MAYFDHNATTPLTEAARTAWLEAQEQAWQNPSAGYRSAARVRALIDRDKARLGQLLGANDSRIVFTSGATEAANAAMGHLASRAAQEDCILISPTEHSCVRAAAARYFPGRVVLLPVDRSGVVDRSALQSRLAGGRVAAVATMAANNETGVIQPWREIAGDCRQYSVPIVCDATQWLGKLPSSALGDADFVLGSAHKFGGPKGSGFLVIPEGPSSRGFCALVGGGQQDGHRAGTEDWPSVAALIAALAEADATASTVAISQRQSWRDSFEAGLIDAIPGCRIASLDAPRLWNTVLIILPFGESQRWVTKLDKRGWEVSTTAACAAAAGHGSATLLSMGATAAESRRALRFSAGWGTSQADWNGLLEALREVAEEMRQGPVISA